MPLATTDDGTEAENGIVVRSGLNRINLAAGNTVAEVYEMCRGVLNMTGTDNLTVVVDGECHDYASVSNSELLAGSVVEYVKASGSKGA